MESGVEKQLKTAELLRDPNFSAPLRHFFSVMRDGLFASDASEVICAGMDSFNEYTDDTVPGHEETRYLDHDLSIMFDGNNHPIRLQRKKDRFQCTIVVDGIKNLSGNGASDSQVAAALNREIISLNEIYSVLLNIEDIVAGNEERADAFRKLINAPFTFNIGVTEDGNAIDFTLGVTVSSRLDAAPHDGYYSIDSLRVNDIVCDFTIKGVIDTLNGTRGDGWSIVYKLYVTPVDVKDLVVSTSLAPDQTLDLAKQNDGDLRNAPDGDECKAIVIGSYSKQRLIVSKILDKKDVDENAVKQLNFERAGKIIESMNSYVSATPIVNLLRYKGHSATQLTEFIKYLYDTHKASLTFTREGVYIRNKHMVLLVNSVDEEKDQAVICIRL